MIKWLPESIMIMWLHDPNWSNYLIQLWLSVPDSIMIMWLPDSIMIIWLTD